MRSICTLVIDVRAHHSIITIIIHSQHGTAFIDFSDRFERYHFFPSAHVLSDIPFSLSSERLYFSLHLICRF